MNQKRVKAREWEGPWRAFPWSQHEETSDTSSPFPILKAISLGAGKFLTLTSLPNTLSVKGFTNVDLKKKREKPRPKPIKSPKATWK